MVSRRPAAYLVAHPDFLLLRGAEITTYAGHGNAVGISAYVDHRIGYQGRTIGGVLDDVAAQHAIFIVNHPKLELGEACIGCAWAHADTDWSKVAGIEVITGNWDLNVNSFVPQANFYVTAVAEPPRGDDGLGHRSGGCGVGGHGWRPGRRSGPPGRPAPDPTTPPRDGVALRPKRSSRARTIPFAGSRPLARRLPAPASS